jgi:NAD(P)-dependent dehydrogenase (short-subunit alcohol dehydrogenase family)
MSDPIELKGARILVTGASTGVGQATAERLMREGASVVATVRKEADGAALRAVGCEVALLDVTDHAAGAALVERVGPLDALINNAAYSYRSSFEHGDDAEIRKMFDVNFFGACALARAALPAMRARRKGAIVNVSSVSGRVAVALNGYYPATKFALEAISESMAYEVRPFNIRVVIVEPGGIKTAFIPNMHLEPRTYDDPNNPYADLAQRLRPTAPGGSEPSVVADTIVRSLVAPAPGKLRWPATPDAEQGLHLRDTMDDDAFMAMQAERAGIKW